MNKIVFKLLNKKFVVKMFLLITAQQILVAGSTALLGLAGQSVAKPQAFLMLLGGFFVLSLLPHVFSVFLKKAEMEGYFDAYFKFIELRLLSNIGQPQKWQNHQQKEKFLTAVGPDAEGYLTAVAFSIFDIYLFALTIVLNITSISLVVDTKFSYVFLISGLLSFLVFKKHTGNIERLVEQEQEAKLSFFGYLLKSWDSVLLKNSVVHSLYAQNLTQHYRTTRAHIGASALKSEGLVFVLTIVASLPVFAMVLYLAFTNTANAAYLAGLMVTIPKQIMILTNFRAFFNQITNLASFKTRFQSSWENSLVEDSHLSSRIREDQIKVNSRPLPALNDFTESIKALSSGRHTITGSNGAGKSTLLLHLNSALPESFYLPATTGLEIGKDLGAESTGEKVMKYLDFISKQQTPVILLDEWDANLDNENKKAISARLDEIARHKVIIEVRHGNFESVTN